MIKFVYVLYLSMFIWMLPPFKQYGTKYFVYFVLMAVSDPLAILTAKYTDITVMQFFLFIMGVQLSSILNKKRIKVSVILSLVINSLIVNFTSNIIIIQSIGGIYLIAILFVLVTEQYFYYERKSINLFLSFMILNVLINIIRYFSTVISPTWGITTFYMGVIVQIIFGLLFTFINIKTKIGFNKLGRGKD